MNKMCLCALHVAAQSAHNFLYVHAIGNPIAISVVILLAFFQPATQIKC